MIEFDEQYWKAVLENDARYDGEFCYAVVTTGVYCLPSCGGRNPNQENVRFYLSQEDAEDEGFRPCKRCKPNLLKSSGNTTRIYYLARFIAQHSDEELSLSSLAKTVQLSPAYLQKKFKALLGVSPKVFQSDARLKRLKKLLRENVEITQAIFEAGFGSTSRVYEQVDGRLGMTPSAYRAGGKGETLYYATCTTVLGELMMAATERGVCFVHFGDNESELLAVLRKEYPNADVLPSPMEESLELSQWITALRQHIDQRKPRPDIPLDLSGTAFQLKVWEFLMSIKEGQVFSYSEVAKGIGSPKAFRAAANACGANNIAVLIPCHRVLRGDGSLGGYRWGESRKRVLLEAERKQTNK